MGRPLPKADTAWRQGGAMKPGARCGLPDQAADAAGGRELEEAYQAWLKKNPDHHGRRLESYTISVIWHVMHDGTNGNIPQAYVDDSITVLNAAFQGTGFQFRLDQTLRHNDKIATNCYNRDNRLKDTYAVQPEKFMNVYSVSSSGYLLQLRISVSSVTHNCLSHSNTYFISVSDDRRYSGLRVLPELVPRD